MSTAAAIAGFGALALLASPSFAAPDQGIPKAGTSVQLAQMMSPSQQGQGMMGQSRQGQSMMGQGRQGHGMMGQGRQGHGMMGQGRQGHGMMGQGRQGQSMLGHGQWAQGMMSAKSCDRAGFGDRVVAPKDLTTDDVSHFLRHRLEMRGNERLMVGDVKQAGEDKIIADITTVDGSLVQRLEIDRHSGKMMHIK